MRKFAETLLVLLLILTAGQSKMAAAEKPNVASPQRTTSIAQILPPIGLAGVAGIAAAAIMPNLTRARENSARTTCFFNQETIRVTTQQWALEKRKPDSATPTEDDLRRYFDGEKMPKCPNGGNYDLGIVAEYPSCSAHGSYVDEITLDRNRKDRMKQLDKERQDWINKYIMKKGREYRIFHKWRHTFQSSDSDKSNFKEYETVITATPSDKNLVNFLAAINREEQMIRVSGLNLKKDSRYNRHISCEITLRASFPKLQLAGSQESLLKEKQILETKYDELRKKPLEYMQAVAVSLPTDMELQTMTYYERRESSQNLVVTGIVPSDQSQLIATFKANMANFPAKDAKGNIAKLFESVAMGKILDGETTKHPQKRWSLVCSLEANREKQSNVRPIAIPDQPNQEDSSAKSSNEIDIDVFIRRNPFNLERWSGLPTLPPGPPPPPKPKTKAKDPIPFRGTKSSGTRSGGSLKAIPSRRKKAKANP